MEHSQVVNPEETKLLRAKFRTYIKLVQYMRMEQYDYFYYKKRHDQQNAQKHLRTSIALENRVDKESEKMLDQIKTHFQPELFR